MIQEVWGKLACRCVQCTWVWFAENKERPKICPNRNCRSRKWNADLEQIERMKPVDVRTIAAGQENRQFSVKPLAGMCVHGRETKFCIHCKLKSNPSTTNL